MYKRNALQESFDLSTFRLPYQLRWLNSRMLYRLSYQSTRKLFALEVINKLLPVIIMPACGCLNDDCLNPGEACPNVLLSEKISALGSASDTSDLERKRDGLVHKLFLLISRAATQGGE
jgi:hypothetical protein